MENGTVYMFLRISIGYPVMHVSQVAYAPSKVRIPMMKNARADRSAFWDMRRVFCALE